MPQQLNLYAPGLCQRRYRDTFGQMLAVQAAIATLGLLAGGVLHWGTQQARTETAALMQQTDQAREALKQSAANTADRQLADQVQRLRTREAGLQRLQTLLDSGRAGRRQGYADHLEALARQAHPSVWLTGLTLQGADDSIELQGRMTDPALLTEYLHQLQSEPQFKGRPFAALNIRRVGASVDTDPEGAPVTSPGPGYSEFTLRSHLAKTGGETSAAVAAQAAVQTLLTPGALVPKP